MKYTDQYLHHNQVHWSDHFFPINRTYLFKAIAVFYFYRCKIQMEIANWEQ